MKKTFTNTLLAILGGLLLLPALAAAQTDTSARPDAASVRTNFTATTTRERPKINASLATSTAAQARIQRAADRAHDEIDRRIGILRKLIERLASMRRVSESFKTDLRAAVETQIRDIEALRARITSSTDVASLRSDLQSITRSYHSFSVAMLKAQIAAAAERIVAMTATMTDIGIKLKDRIDAAAREGHDVEALNQLLRSLSAHIDAANGHARAAVDGTATLEPDSGDAVAERIRAAFQAAREALRLAHEEVRAGREDIQAIIDGLKNLRDDSDATTEESVETDVE